MKKDNALTFPCEFPVKVMGKVSDTFEATIKRIVKQHVPDLKDDAVSVKPSSNGNYVSITAKFTATSQAQLDDLYRDLSAHPDVIMVL